MVTWKVHLAQEKFGRYFIEIAPFAPCSPFSTVISFPKEATFNSTLQLLNIQSPTWLARDDAGWISEITSPGTAGLSIECDA